MRQLLDTDWAIDYFHANDCFVPQARVDLASERSCADPSTKPSAPGQSSGISRCCACRIKW